MRLCCVIAGCFSLCARIVDLFFRSIGTCCISERICDLPLAWVMLVVLIKLDACLDSVEVFGSYSDGYSR